MVSLSIEIFSRSGSVDMSASSSSSSSNSASRVSALRSQFESLVTRRNSTAPRTPKKQKTSEASISERVNTEENEEDVCSNYGDDDDTVEAAEEFHNSDRLTPEHYTDIAATNPYGEDSEDQKKGECVPVTEPQCAETMEEALARLSSELEQAHQAIENGKEAVLQQLKELAL